MCKAEKEVLRGTQTFEGKEIPTEIHAAEELTEEQMAFIQKLDQASAQAGEILTAAGVEQFIIFRWSDEKLPSRTGCMMHCSNMNRMHALESLLNDLPPELTLMALPKFKRQMGA